MFKRFVYTSLISFGLGFGLFSTNTAMTPLQADEPQPVAQVSSNSATANQAQPSADLTALAEKGIEVLDKGPVHEAFAQPVDKNPQPGPIVHKQPPQLVNEVPPEQKPEGDNVQWIKGYWAWDADRNDFIWVSGFWRVAPPARHWVQGSWVQVDDGWQWSPGYWAANQQDATAYLPAPPESLDYGPSTSAPSDDAFYVPGNWVYTNSDYAWQPGFWSYSQPGFIWNPASYYWTPYGYTYCSGYWDYPWWNRGLLFAPVFFHRPFFFNNFFFRPFFAVNTPFLSTFFFHPHHHQFFFGRFGDPFFARSGFQVASFNRVNNSINITNINNINSKNVTNVVTNRAGAGSVLAPATRVAAHTRLGAGATASRGVTRPNTVGSRPGTLTSGSINRGTSGSVNRGSSFATTGRSTPGAGGNIHTTPRVTSSGSGSAVTHGGLHERGPAPLSSNHLSSPVTRHEAASPHVGSPHLASPQVSHYSAPRTTAPLSHYSAPAASHLSAPSVHAAPSHFSAPAMHAPAAHFSSGGGHVGGAGHFSGGSASHFGGGGHFSAPAHSAPAHGGGHAGGSPHGHR